MSVGGAGVTVGTSGVAVDPACGGAVGGAAVKPGTNGRVAEGARVAVGRRVGRRVAVAVGSGVAVAVAVAVEVRVAVAVAVGDTVAAGSGVSVTVGVGGNTMGEEVGAGVGCIGTTLRTQMPSSVAA